jgi:hypothetical protein
MPGGIGKPLSEGKSAHPLPEGDAEGSDGGHEMPSADDSASGSAGAASGGPLVTGASLLGG